MKFVHLSDLHIGKNLCGFSLIEDQKYILDEILKKIKEISPQGVFIAGDVYDRSVPSAEAVTLFDSFITKICRENIPLYIISGNHDSAERLSYGGEIFKDSKIYFSPVYSGSLEKIQLIDDFGKLNVYLCPFVKPANVKQFFPDDKIESFNDAIKSLIFHEQINECERNILLCHQFVTGAETCESEDINVGTLDNVDAQNFDCFDYVALGHIHGPQKVYRDSIRYCGTPLKYSFSEVNHRKSMSVVEIFEKGNVEIETIPLVPLRELRKIKGKFEDIVSYDFYSKYNKEDYFHVTLTDENDIVNGMEKLRSVFPNIMTLEYDNKRTQNTRSLKADEKVSLKTPFELLNQHYEAVNNRQMSSDEREFVNELIDEIWGEN